MFGIRVDVENINRVNTLNIEIKWFEDELDLILPDINKVIIASQISIAKSQKEYDELGLSIKKEDVIAVLNDFDSVMLTPSIISEVLSNGEVSQRMQFLAQGGLLLITIAAQRIDVQITSNDLYNRLVSSKWTYEQVIKMISSDPPDDD